MIRSPVGVLTARLCASHNWYDAAGSCAPQAWTAKNDVVIATQVVVCGFLDNDILQQVLAGSRRERCVPERACYVGRVCTLAVAEGEQPSSGDIKQSDRALCVCEY